MSSTLPPGPTIRELTPSEFPLILPLIEKHNAKIAPEELRRRLEEMIPKGYHCIAASEGGVIVGVAGYWLLCRFYSGLYMDVDNVVVEETRRSGGIGAAMMDWLENHARTLGCHSVMLDSYVTLARAHKIYFGRSYEILGFHFIKTL